MLSPPMNLHRVKHTLTHTRIEKILRRWHFFGIKERASNTHKQQSEPRPTSIRLFECETIDFHGFHWLTKATVYPTSNSKKLNENISNRIIRIFSIWPSWSLIFTIYSVIRLFKNISHVWPDFHTADSIRPHFEIQLIFPFDFILYSQHLWQLRVADFHVCNFIGMYIDDRLAFGMFQLLM